MLCVVVSKSQKIFEFYWDVYKTAVPKLGSFGMARAELEKKQPILFVWLEEVKASLVTGEQVLSTTPTSKFCLSSNTERESVRVVIYVIAHWWHNFLCSFRQLNSEYIVL